MVDKTYVMESETASKEVFKTIKIINYEISNLDSTAIDWAFWNDTYYFVLDNNNDYILDNLMDDTFSTLKINFFVITDKTGKIVYKKAYDLAEEKELDFPQSLEDSIINTDIFIIDETDSSLRGILKNEDAPVFLASRPILKSDSTGPIAGTLIIGRFVDSREVNTLSEIAPYPFNLYNIEDQETNKILETLPSDFLESGEVTSKAVSDSEIRGYYILKDVYGEPGLILEIELPRDAYMASKQAGFYFFIIMLGFGILFGIAFLLAVEKGILSKIFALEKEVKEISLTKDYSYRLKSQEKDEIDSLATNINEMIENIQKSSIVLKESEKRYRTLFEESMDSIWATKLDGKIVDANEAAAKLLGLDLNDLIGSNIMAFYESPQDRLEFQKKVSEFGSVKEYPLNFKAKDGNIINCLISFAAWRDSKGNIIGYRGIAHNITQRKIYEKQLLELNDTLKVINKILRHDILNELTVVMSICDLIQTKDDKLKDKMIKTIYKSVNLIDKMRELEQAVTSGGQMKSYDLQNVILEIVKNYPTVEFSITGNCKVLADEAINSVVDNLIRNAVVHGKTDKIDFKIDHDENYCTLKITDYGKGIPQEIKEDIFEEGASFGDNRGTGLGLFIVKKVIERYGGSIIVEDNKQTGSTFIIKLKKL
jgi:PAS domain S-box-containing protein